MRAVTKFGCPFAIKSGGHASFAGASSTPGVLIDLVKLNHVRVEHDQKAVQVGPGCRWIDVYPRLERLGLTVIGGRDANVGVGGFLLGGMSHWTTQSNLLLTIAGGISFFSNIYGWACDNILAYDVVLPHGKIVTASATEHPDLFRALRGGGPNFGVVTSFKLRAIPYGGMWGGVTVHDLSATDMLLKKMIAYDHDSVYDPKLSVILNFGKGDGQWQWANEIHYCAPKADADFFNDWMTIPSTANTTTVAELSAHTLDLASRTPANYRCTFWTLSTELDFAASKSFVKIFIEECEKVENQVVDFEPSICMQLITTSMIKQMSTDGGNVLGLSEHSGPLILYLISSRWSKASDDHRVYNAMNSVIQRAAEAARKLGKANDFLYMNYASQFQRVIPSYGEANGNFLREVSHKYDPLQALSALQNYFPLYGQERHIGVAPAARKSLL